MSDVSRRFWPMLHGSMCFVRALMIEANPTSSGWSPALERWVASSLSPFAYGILGPWTSDHCACSGATTMACWLFPWFGPFVTWTDRGDSPLGNESFHSPLKHATSQMHLFEFPSTVLCFQLLTWPDSTKAPGSHFGVL